MTKPYKAIAAFVLTFVGCLIASVEGKKEFSDLTTLEWLIVIGTAVVTTGAVYQITNPPVEGRPYA
jgi:uncharacterized membrane protein YcaP (DUF421 family)